MLKKKIRHQGPRWGVSGRRRENNGFGSHTCGGLFAFGNKERNDKRKARARSHRLKVGCGKWEGGEGGGGIAQGVGARYANNGEIMYRLQ